LSHRGDWRGFFDSARAPIFRIKDMSYEFDLSVFTAKTTAMTVKLSLSSSSDGEDDDSRATSIPAVIQVVPRLNDTHESTVANRMTREQTPQLLDASVQQEAANSAKLLCISATQQGASLAQVKPNPVVTPDTTTSSTSSLVKAVRRKAVLTALVEQSSPSMFIQQLCAKETRAERSETWLDVLAGFELKAKSFLIQIALPTRTQSEPEFGLSTLQASEAVVLSNAATKTTTGRSKSKLDATTFRNKATRINLESTNANRRSKVVSVIRRFNFDTPSPSDIVFAARNKLRAQK
jgi:hypothetical protein